MRRRVLLLVLLAFLLFAPLVLAQATWKFLSLVPGVSSAHQIRMAFGVPRLTGFHEPAAELLLGYAEYWYYDDNPEPGVDNLTIYFDRDRLVVSVTVHLSVSIPPLDLRAIMGRPTNTHQGGGAFGEQWWTYISHDRRYKIEWAQVAEEEGGFRHVFVDKCKPINPC